MDWKRKFIQISIEYLVVTTKVDLIGVSGAGVYTPRIMDSYDYTKLLGVHTLTFIVSLNKWTIHYLYLHTDILIQI
jgi:hypothetical protein